MSDLIQRHRAAADSHRNREGNASAALCKFHDDTADEIERQARYIKSLEHYEVIHKQRIAELEALVKMGEAVVEDFMPNIGRCALQDYGRLNEFLMAAAKLQEKDEDENEEVSNNL